MIQSLESSLQILKLRKLLERFLNHQYCLVILKHIIHRIQLHRYNKDMKLFFHINYDLPIDYKKLPQLAILILKRICKPYHYTCTKRLQQEILFLKLFRNDLMLASQFIFSSLYKMDFFNLFNSLDSFDVL